MVPSGVVITFPLADALRPALKRTALIPEAIPLMPAPKRCAMDTRASRITGKVSLTLSATLE